MLTLARAYLAAHRVLLRRVAAALAALWAELDPQDLSGSWQRGRVGERAFVTLGAYQAQAVARADEWVRDAVAEQDGDVDDVRVEPRRLAGRSSDGGLIEPRLYTSVVRVKLAIRRGTPDRDAIAAGGRTLERIGVSEVADAARAATQAALTAQPAVSGWVRVVNLPACGRCVALAGERFGWDDPILVHPRCDCTVMPAVGDGADDLLVDPDGYFESLVAAEQDARFGPDAAERIRGGADVRAAVDPSGASSGMSPVGALHPRPVGPTVRSLLDQADGDRDEAARLLREHGFLI